MIHPTNNRDCEHGRQLGKCDTCDLIEAEKEIEQLKSQLIEVQNGATGKAPCAKYCEAKASYLTMKRLHAEIERLQLKCELRSRSKLIERAETAEQRVKELERERENRLKAQGIREAVGNLERPDVPGAPTLILNDDLTEYANKLEREE